MPFPLKPAIPITNWSNPLTRGLVFDAQYFEGGGLVTKDLASYITGTIAASGTTWETNKYGKDLDFSAAASKITYTPVATQNNLTKYSIEMLLSVRSNGGGTAGRILLKGATNTYFMVYTSAGMLRFQANWTAVGEWNITQPSIALHHFIITYDTTNVANDAIFYLDGAQQSVTRNATPSGTLKADDATLYIGNRADGTRNFDGKLVYTRLYNRILSAQAAKQLATNPWQIYNRYN
jgi:hypothetical protein